MYIKYVRIHGFKSYREKTVCGPLSPMHNSVVGFNGTGKSNFFAALKFVLGDGNHSLRPEERSKLLNEGAGASVMTAYVEIVFDNSDRRIDSEKEEVTIKRMIGLKKDEYFLDNKHVARTEIQNLLETAGFSKSNPYYIVEQGKVTAITTMADGQRLALIKDVAGTNVYDEKKTESEKILATSLLKMDEIKNNLGMIEARLEKLDKEKQELSEYYALDKERRSLHHALLSKRIQVLREKLTELDRKKQELRIDSGRDSHTKELLQTSKETLQKSVDELLKRLQSIEEERETLNGDEDRNTEAELKQKGRVEHVLQATEKNNKEIKAKTASLVELEATIAKLEDSVRKIEPKIQQHKEQQGKTLQEYHAVDREKANLQAMRSKSEYRDQAARDKFINTELSKVEMEMSSRKRDSSQATADIKKCEGAKLDLEKKKTEIGAQLANFSKDKGKQQAAILVNYEESLVVEKQIHVLRKSHVECQAQKSKNKKDLDDMGKKLNNGMPNGCAKALEFLESYCKHNKIHGYYGPLIDLIHCNEKYYTAVEQTGGRQMFSAVVDDQHVASKLVEAMQADKGGCRMTFMPLSKLQPHKTHFPQGLQDAEPLSKCIKSDAKFRVAVDQVFGSALLCSDLDVANKYRREHDLECVTMDGDKVQRKGAIKGGYHDHTNSKLKQNQQKREQSKANVELDVKEEAAKMELQQWEQKHVQLETKKKQLENAQNKSDSNFLNKQQDDISSNIRYNDEDITTHKNVIEKNTNEIKELQHKIDTLRDQLAQPFSQTITGDQVKRLNELTQKHTQLERRQREEEATGGKLLQEQSQKESARQNALSEVDGLKQAVAKLQGESSIGSVEMEQLKLRELGSQMKACTENNSAKEKELAQVTELLRREKDELKQVENKIKSQSNENGKVKNQLGSIAADREKCQKDKEVAERQLMELGSLPEAFDKYKDRSEKNLNDSLVKVTEKLGKFKNVNKKAMDQFNQFTDQKVKFQERITELATGEDSIRKLIVSLDQKKETALHTTFKMVARHFAEVFKTIVPGGEGKIIMKTSTKRGAAQGEEDDEGEGSSSRPGGKEFTGIGVEVRFAAGGKIGKMSELSGGQKRCDPAPFYLFDEVDAALDPMYRGAVANMISQQKLEKDGKEHSGCQFVTSSFHEELVKAADVHWLVSHSGMSRINKGTVDDQLKIVRRNTQDRESKVSKK